jgi:hypothetical protein
MSRICFRSAVCLGLFAVAACICILPARGQQTLGSINGTVVDSSGSEVPGATVTATDTAINLVRATTTQKTGFFQIFNLPVGIYTLTISHAGYETSNVSGIDVQEAGAKTINVRLSIGRVAQTIEVTASPLLNATDATNGYTLDQAQIESAPLATGSFTQLAALSPGVNEELLSGIGTNAGLGNQPIWANGQRDTSNTFQVDGVDVTNLFNGKTDSSATSLRVNFNIGSGADGGVGLTGGSATTSTSVYGSNGNGLPTPPPEFLQEIRVNASMYDAEQGATSGAQVDANTLTGTNHWHGLAYGYLGTNDLNAAPYFFKQTYLLSEDGIGSFPEALENPSLHRWTVGGTAGGPVFKDKLFFFGGYQHLYTSDQTQGISQIGVPVGLTNDRSTAVLLSALNSWNDPSGATTAYTSYDMGPIAVALLNAKLPNGQYLIPSAQSKTLNNGNDVTLLAPTLFTGDQATASLDYNLTKTDRLSLKYYYQHDPASNPFIIAKTEGFPEVEDSGAQVAALDNTVTIGPRVNWEQRVGIMRQKVYSNFKQEVAGLTDPTLGIAFPHATGLPGMSLGKFNCNGKTASCGNNSAGITTGPYSEFVDDGYFQNRINPSTNLIFVMGKHTFVAGGGVSYTQLNIHNLRTGLGQLSTTDFSTFLSGKIHSASLLDSIGADGHNYSNRYYRSSEIAGYLQDKFQARDNLSLTAGVRYDYHGGLTEKYGNLFNFEPSMYDVEGDTNTGFNVINAGFVVAGNNKYNPTAGVSDSTLTGRQWGLSPRLGFAWSPHRDDGKFVVSGGGGIYYDRGEFFSYLSQPAGGGIGGPFGVTMAPPLAAAYTASNTNFQNPMGSTVITPPNPNPAYFTSALQKILTDEVANCTALGNEYDGGGGYGCDVPFYFGAYDRANKLPYSINYALTIQWQPASDLAVSIGYNGNRGRHLIIPLPFNEPQIAAPNHPAMVMGKEPHANGEAYSYGYQVLNQNATVPCYSGGPTCYLPIATEKWDSYEGGNIDFRVPYPGYDPSAALFKAEGNSAYDALEAHLEKRFAQHYQVTASYTWGHALDEQSDIGLFFTGDNPDDLHDSWASSDFDRTHVFSASFEGDVPNSAKAHSLASYLVNDWKLSGLTILQSGEPYSLYEFYGAVGSVFFGNYPNLANPVLPIKDPGNPRSALTGQKGSFRDASGNYYPAIDPTQVSIPYITPGDSGVPPCDTSDPCDIYETGFAPTRQRNIFRQSPQKSLDLSLHKAFAVGERVSMDYEFNAFNVTNTTSLDIPQDQTQIGQAYVGSEAGYGQVQATKGQESAQLSSLYVMPTATKTSSGQTISPTNFGSVTNTIGSARMFTGAVHITF